LPVQLTVTPFHLPFVRNVFKPVSVLVIYPRVFFTFFCQLPVRTADEIPSEQIPRITITVVVFRPGSLTRIPPQYRIQILMEGINAGIQDGNDHGIGCFMPEKLLIGTRDTNTIYTVFFQVKQ